MISGPCSVFFSDLSKIKDFPNITLHKLIPQILSFHVAHFNDEGETLCGDENEIDIDKYESLDVKYWIGYGQK